MPFTYKDYGTFTGPNSISGDYNYDEVSKEDFWYTDLPNDTSFKLTDLATVLFHSPGDYVGFYCNGVSTQLMTFAHSTGPIPTLIVNASNTTVSGNIIANGTIIANGATTVNGVFTATSAILTGTINTQSWKSFDISHPTKENHRLVHACIEGPEAGVYYRGKLINSNIIELPEYWMGLVDFETITVNLTPHESYQQLFVKYIDEEDARINICNNLNEPIHCSYVVYGKRKDVEDLIVEYEGTEIIPQELRKK